MKRITELCLRTFRVRRSLQKNETKNKKGNVKKKKEKKKEKKKTKKEKNVKRGEKNTSKGKKNKNLKNKPKAENNSKKCKVKKGKPSKKVRSKRADQDPCHQDDPGQNPGQDPGQDKHWRDPKPNMQITKPGKMPDEFNAILEEVKSCFLTPASSKDRFCISFCI